MTAADEIEFTAEEWLRLAPSERVQRCLAFAEHAKTLSANAPPDTKENYLDLSRHWFALANEIRQIAKGASH